MEIKVSDIWCAVWVLHPEGGTGGVSEAQTWGGAVPFRPPQNLMDLNIDVY